MKYLSHVRLISNNMQRITAFLLILFSVLVSQRAIAEHRPSAIVKGIAAEGACAVVGMSAEQARLIALQRARVAAIEQAVGVKVTSNTVVTNARLAVDFMRTYSKGYIVNEKVEWPDIGQYRRNPGSPPIPEYRVKLTADVYKPERKIKPLGLTAKINEKLFRSGEKGQITIKAERKAKVAIFNITAEDKVVMIFPNQYEKDNVIKGNKTFLFPEKDSPISLVFQTLPGHKRDAEAVLVIAMDVKHERRFIDIFKPSKPMRFTEFFGKYSEIADYCEDELLTYEVSK